MHWIPTKMALLVTSVSAALVLAACGGGGSDTSTKVTYTSLVSFGDSLSDVGTYKVGLIDTVGGGRWTVNGTTTGPVNWTELLAGQINVAAPCPAQTGLLSNIPAIPLVAKMDHDECTNYAQGSSRVTSEFGSNSVAVQLATGETNPGLMAVPLQKQFEKHLTVHGSYTGKELVTVMAGANDVFVYAGGVQTIAAIAAGAGTGGDAAIEAAVVSAEGKATTSATELAGYIQTLVLDKGAKYVVVVNVPGIENTPYGQATGASGVAAIKRIVTAFNTKLQSSVKGLPGIVFVDAYAQSVDQFQNPKQYGLVNVTVPACGAAGNILGGSALTCTTANVTAGVDVSTSLYADGVHPTPAGYKLLDRYVAEQMAKAGWL